MEQGNKSGETAVAKMRLKKREKATDMKEMESKNWCYRMWASTS